jgi:hypothetical protein
MYNTHPSTDVKNYIWHLNISSIWQKVKKLSTCPQFLGTLTSKILFNLSKQGDAKNKLQQASQAFKCVHSSVLLHQNVLNKGFVFAFG